MVLAAIAIANASADPDQATGLAAQIDERVEAIIRQLTLEEKVSLLGGVDGFYTRDIPHLGIPRLKMSDGPLGVRNYGPTTSYPAGLCLAATFDTELAHRYGTQMGRDARARGVHVWLGPGVNLARVPQCGRNFEYLGEDPLVAGLIAAELIKGIQKEGVVATVKHFAANEHESDRMKDSSVVDERTLRELYLKPFEIAVKEGQVWAVMCSYNKLNGTYAAEDPYLIQQVLKGDWGFRGIIMSDWGAVHSSLPTAKNGLDLEMPGPQFMNMRLLKPFLDSGELTTAAIDDKVRRLLRMTLAMEFEKRPQELADIPKADPASEALSDEEARKGFVLLKNDRHLLPLLPEKLKRIVVVGPNADPAVTGGGGSAYTTPNTPVSLLQAIKEALPNVEIAYSEGVADADNSYRSTAFYQLESPEMIGLKAEFFDNSVFSGEPKVTRVDEKLNLWWWDAPPAAGLPPTRYSIRWSGLLKPKATGEYLLFAGAGEGLKIKVGDDVIFDDLGKRWRGDQSKAMALTGGKSYPITVEAQITRRNGHVSVGLAPTGKILEAELPDEFVRSADAVIVSVGFNNHLETEGFDRPFDLPASQQALLQRMVTLSPKTVVLNNSGGPVYLTPFVARMGALIQAWYPGGTGNRPLVEMLLGKTNPSGKLPLSWPRQLEGTYYADAWPSKDETIPYSEGLFMGYRWFDAHQAEPLFPYGFGMSYTTFEFSRPVVRLAGRNIEVEVMVKNTGKVVGDEVVQVYTGYVKSRVERPVRELRGFQRVSLSPGESKSVHLSIPLDRLAYYDVPNHRWVVEPGEVVVSIGNSSRNLPFQKTLAIK